MKGFFPIFSLNPEFFFFLRVWRKWSTLEDFFGKKPKTTLSKSISFFALMVNDVPLLNALFFFLGGEEERKITADKSLKGSKNTCDTYKFIWGGQTQKTQLLKLFFFFDLFSESELFFFWRVWRINQYLRTFRQKRFSLFFRVTTNSQFFAFGEKINRH